MREIGQILLYKFKTIWRDKMQFTLLILLPVLFTLLVGGVEDYEKKQRIPIAVVDCDHSNYSQLVLERFKAKSGVQVLEIAEIGKARELVKNYQVEAAFIIKKGFQERINQESIAETITLLKSPNSLSYILIQEVLSSEVIRLAANEAAANWVLDVFQTENLKLTSEEPNLWSAVWDYADSHWEPEPLMTMEYQELAGESQHTVARKSISVLSSLTLGMLLFFLMLLLLFNSSWLIEERNNATLKRIKMIPGFLQKYFAANLLFLLLLGLIQVVFLVVAVYLIFDVQIFTSAYQYLLIICYLLAVIAVGMLLSIIFQTPMQLQSAAPLVALLTSVLGGCFWAFIDPPESIQNLSLVTPQGWVIKGFQDSLTVGESNLQVIGILLLGTFMLYLIAYVRMKKV
jgi:ABC-2 type transport system permease protein